MPRFGLGASTMPKGFCGARGAARPVHLASPRVRGSSDAAGPRLRHGAADGPYRPEPHQPKPAFCTHAATAPLQSAADGDIGRLPAGGILNFSHPKEIKVMSYKIRRWACFAKRISTTLWSAS